MIRSTATTGPAQRRLDRVLLIANPTSGGGKAGRWLQRVAAAFETAGLRVESCLTDCAGDGLRAARERAGEDGLTVTFGGDGTFNEVLNGADLERTTLALIPAGTGNVLGKELGMSKQPLRAVRQILDGRTARLDMGLCNGRRFISVFGAGLDGWVVHQVHRHREGGLTQLHYVPHVVRGMLRPREWDIRVQADGRLFADGMGQVAVGNSRSYGGPIQLTPAAAPNDGELDLMCAPQKRPEELACVVACSLFRSLHRSPLVRYGRARRVTVTSSPPHVPYQVDGEPAGTLPAEIEIRPAAVRMRAPRSFNPVRRGLPAWRRAESDGGGSEL